MIRFPDSRFESARAPAQGKPKGLVDNGIADSTPPLRAAANLFED
jgi:hypothetical protein